MPKQAYNEKICSTCGGKCCKIYLSIDRGGSKPFEYGFEEWCEEFHEHSDRYGIEPLFEPMDVHLVGNEHLIEKLKRQGIDAYSCQYLNPKGNGCMIPWEKRPIQCKKYVCEKWN